MKDLTKNYDYARLIQEEKDHFTHFEITEDLKVGGVHAHAAWHYYWDRVARFIDPSGFRASGKFLAKHFAGQGRPIRILSLGSGYCGYEIDFAREMPCGYEITCTDINEDIFQQARDIAAREGLAIEFGVADLNFMTIEPGRYDFIFAHAAIHHVINLEHLFDQIAVGLAPNGIFHLVEVVGKNRKLIWDVNERFANAVLDLVPFYITKGVRLAIQEDLTGMEGIRQADILPLVRKKFRPLFEHRHGAYMRYICTHGELGPEFDPGDDRRRRYLDLLIDCDEAAVGRGALEGLELYGFYQVA